MKRLGLFLFPQNGMIFLCSVTLRINSTVPKSYYTPGAPEIRIQQAEKKITVLSVNWNSIEIRKHLSLEMALNIRQKSFKTPLIISYCKKLKYETLFVSKLPIWRQKWVTGVRHGNSLVVRGLSPDRLIDNFWFYLVF